MIRFLRLFLWLRWKLFVGHLEQAKAKGTLSQVGAILGVVAVGFVGVLMALASVVLAVTAAGGAVALVAEVPEDALLSTAIEAAEARTGALFVLRLGLFLLLGMLLIMPAVRAGRGSFGKGSGGLTRLLLLPLSRRHLHASEVVANALDPFILTFLPALLVLGGVLAAQVGAMAGTVAVAASVLMLLALMAWSALLGIALQLLFRDRKRAELALLLVFMAWIGLSVVPGLADVKRDREREARQAAEQREPPSSPDVATAAPEPETPQERKERQRLRTQELAETFPVWLQWIPSESYTRSLALASQGRGTAALPSLAALAAFVAACWWLSSKLWERLIGSPENSGDGRAVDVSRWRARGLPGVSLQTAGVAFATARGFLRTVRGKLALAMTPLMVLVFGYMFQTGKKVGAIEALFGGLTSMLGAFAIMMSLLSILPISANAFASDRAGFTLQALAPISETRLVWGKTLGCLLVHLACLLPSLVAVQVWDFSNGIAGFLDVLLLGAAAFAFSAPAGIWLSVLFPKQADLGALGNEGNPHQLAQLVAMLVMGLGMGAATLGGWLGQFLLAGSIWGRVLGTGLTCGLAWLLAWPLLIGAAGALRERWEAVVTTAQGR